jgi:ABC-type multidrug transport system ATPase subunit
VAELLYGEATVVLTISNLSKTYPNGVKALKNLSLTIGNGMFGLVGPNGAGKSSLMRTVVATLQGADSGSIQPPHTQFHSPRRDSPLSGARSSESSCL